MDGGLTRREAARPRRVSAAAELGANASLQDGEVMEVHPARDAHPGPDRIGAAAAGGRMERRNSVTQSIHQRHMPIDPLKFHIPKKTKEKRALFHYVSTESREFEDMMTILTSSYIDTTSAGSFTYSKPRLVHSELLEKEFVEKRREMKADGRTDKELEESYCFLLADTAKVHCLCEKGLLLGHSRVTVLGNPAKGVYLSRYSDLLQINLFTPGFTGDIIIFKVMKGKVKSFYENMKNLLDPTPRFDSHISKNIGKVTSINAYRAYELTQHYFYEYSFDELRERPRQVCPYAVVSFQFKSKDSLLPSKPLTPSRLNSQSAEGSKERAQFTVWSGNLVKGHCVLYQISLCSSSPPHLPHRLPEKLEIGSVMSLDQATGFLPSDLFSYNLYSSSQEVVKSGHYCSLLEVTDRFRSSTSVTKLLQELEKNRVVLVTPLTDRGFLFLLSSVQMATPPERGESWKRCLQALFIFPETRDVARSAQRHASTSHDTSVSQIFGGQVMQRLNQFIPAMHHSLVKARANPPPELSAGVERQAKDYLIGLKDGKVRPYPMGEYDSTLEEGGAPPPKYHRVNLDGYLRSYLYNPAFYLLSVARARQVVEAHCGLEDPREAKRRSSRDQREAAAREATSTARDEKNNTEQMQDLVDLVITCKRNAENEVRREEAGRAKTPGRKRRLEQAAAERAIKLLKASQEPGGPRKNPVEGIPAPAPPGSLASVIGSLGLKDFDLREDGSELSANLLSLLTGLSQAARGIANQSPAEIQEESQGESFPFDRLATKLGLPTSCDIDLRRQDELEEQMAGSISSLEGFSPGSHSGEINHTRVKAAGYEEVEEEWEVPWVLIPITGLSSERYTHRDRNIPQDPRFQHLTTATAITMPTKPHRKSSTLAPEPSPSPILSHAPSPPPSPFLSLSPQPSPPHSPSQCPSPEPSPPPSPSQCPSPQPSPPLSPSQCPSPHLSPPSSPLRCQSPESNEPSLFGKNQSGANEEQIAPASWASTGVLKNRGEVSQRTEETEDWSISSSIHPFIVPSPETRIHLLPPPAEQEKDAEGVVVELRDRGVELLKENKETQVSIQTQKQKEEAKTTQEVEMMQVETCDNKLQEAAQELTGSTSFSPSVSSPPLPRSHRGIDNIVDKHLGDFSSDIQLLLQEESVHYSCPQSPHSTSNTDTSALPHTLTTQFSQYVTFYNPRPPVQDYVSSLQDSMNSMLTKFDDGWLSSRTATTQTNTDVSLESTVSAFVSSIRAANVKTDRGDDELTDADSGGQVWQPLTITKQFSDAGGDRNSPTFHVTLSDSTSVPGSASTAVLHTPRHSPTLEITRTVVNDIREPPDSSSSRTVLCTSSAEGTNFEVTLPGFSSVSKSLSEPSITSEPLSSPANESVPGPCSGPAPPATALSSLISQLQPEVFSSLVEIIKDVKRNSLQFYLHMKEPGDLVYEGIKEQLLKQGHLQQQSPVAFLNQENSDKRLLVIIKNEEISGNVHKIPGLVSLKRQPSVVFMGIDTPDDVMNNSFNELFVSGGCIVSDELVLNPDYISHNRLDALLKLLEQHSSPDNMWRWKVHFKTHKKLKEQARFRRDAASLLDLLSAYQKRQIVEFLPYHHCDMNAQQSPDKQCLLELQSRYTLYRHTVFLTERNFEELRAYSEFGIIVASIDEILHDFPRLVSDNKDKQPITDEIMDPKDLLHPVSSIDQSHHLLHQPSSGLNPLSRLSDQLVPDASFRDGVVLQSAPDFEALHQAISQLRAERQAQLQQLQQQRVDSKSLQRSPLKSALTGGFLANSLSGPTESVKKSPGKKAVAATLDLIHSELHPEEEEEERGEEGAESLPGGQRTGGEGGDQRETTALTSHQNSAVGRGPTSQREPSHNGRETVDQPVEQGGTASSSTVDCPVVAVRSRKSTPDPEPVENVTVGSVGVTEVTGGMNTLTEPGNKPNPVPGVQQPQQRPALVPRPAQVGVGLLQSLQHPSLPHIIQAPPHGPMMAPLNSLGGLQGLLGPTQVWTGGLVWGLPQGGRGFSGQGPLGPYHNSAPRGSNWYRGGQRGGGFNRM
ncbi:protein TASOR-like [Cheilinus undulatus]|uniref:protein TASOR-like n=1 Tax=Cheilinus undulatus TaxID=241271 RepID=UPI001BD41ECE|nr:protein TASOR-like [Cheilinus undulatus]